MIAPINVNTSEISLSARRPKLAIFGVLSAPMKDSRQFKQRVKRLFKVVTINLYHYTNNYNTIKSCISWCGDPQTWAVPPKGRKNRPREKANWPQCVSSYRHLIETHILVLCSPWALL
jgi:hypothetical protein